MENSYEFLIEKEEMWARMLMEVLMDNGIPCEALPVYGAVMVMRGGKQERLRVFVPSDRMAEAGELVTELFSQDASDDTPENE